MILEVQMMLSDRLSMIWIHSGTVRDVGVPVLAAPSTIHRGSTTNNSHSQLQIILSCTFSRPTLEKNHNIIIPLSVQIYMVYTCMYI